jgi:hypothetical protein
MKKLYQKYLKLTEELEIEPNIVDDEKVGDSDESEVDTGDKENDNSEKKILDETDISNMFPALHEAMNDPTDENFWLLDTLYENRENVNGEVLDVIFENYFLNEKENHYHRFFKNHLKKFGVSKLRNLTKDRKRDFFNSLKRNWKLAKKVNF